MKFLVIFSLLSAPVWAESCPPTPDSSAELSALIDQIREAKDERAAKPISDQMWEIWLDAPDDAAQDLLNNGLRQRNNFDFVGALETFDRLTEYCPAYAEGYNQRAFTHFMVEDYSKALNDLDIALDLSPDHVGVQSGRALTLMNMGLLDEARTQMQAALDNNPWLSERALMENGALLGPKGEDI
ncbi:MAG: tetratricopeptide repeat protein [Tateyamaria sp.]|uniref:tetratricopeptide repeat protein n=1 Tax=Tateyamaria sp. TaxID=1929288 RepID=UPI00329BC85A